MKKLNTFDYFTLGFLFLGTVIICTMLIFLSLNLYAPASILGAMLLPAVYGVLGTQRGSNKYYG